MEDENWKQTFDSFYKENGNTFIRFLLNAGLDVNTMNKYGQTILSYAAESGNLELTEFLVEKGTDGNVSNSNGSKPLHIAAGYGRKDIVKFFLERGISADSCDNNKYTPLHYVARCCMKSSESYQEIVHSLVDSNADLNALDREGLTPLLLSAKKSHKHIVELFIKIGANLHCCDEGGWTVLHYSAMRGWPGIVRFLVEGRSGIDLNARTSNGDTPMLLAAGRSFKDTVGLLIEMGADVDCCDNMHWTLVHYCCFKGWLDILIYLANAGCDLNAESSNFWLPLHLAAEYSHLGVFEYLVESGVNLGRCGKFQCTALHFACKNSWLDTAKSLIKKVCDLNAQNVFKDSPLHYAVRVRNVEIVSLLLKSGADWNLENNPGKTPFNECIQSPLIDLECIVLFIKNGAYIQSNDYNVIIDKPLLKESILKDIGMCTQVVINQFNNADLPKVYKIPQVAEWLPTIDKLKISRHRNVVQVIAESVKYEIQTKGYFDLLNVRPVVLSCLSIRSLVQYYDNSA